MKPITIIGGGLAGLSLGIALRKRGVPVTVYEAGRYPRHRVCGEFISGNGRRVLRELGLNTVCARTARFFSRRDQSWHFDLPEPALCVSRYVLDQALADVFCRCGGTLICDTRFASDAEGTVHATGRRRHPVENGWRWFGLKAHVTGIELEADLEMHLLPNGYVGICRLPDGQFNVCGLFRKRKDSVDRATLSGPEGSSLRARLQNAHWIDRSFVAVAGVCFCPPKPNNQCHLGDAYAMIAPLTGNGMSMAFESAEAATEPLIRYTQGEAAWPQTVERINAGMRQDFGWRLRWGNWAQSAAFQPWLLSFGARAGLVKLLFAATR